MNVEFIIKALKIQMRRIEEAISAVEAVAEDEIQGRHDARENIRPQDKKAAGLDIDRSLVPRRIESRPRQSPASYARRIPSR
jgi:hypothetical protein